MKREKVYRDGDMPGRDYQCDKCRCQRRLWREYNTIADATKLLCCDCARDLKKLTRPQLLDPTGMVPLVSFARHSAEMEWLVPARPTEDGFTFWGHGAGDWSWWLSLRQEKDDVHEDDVIRYERLMFVAQAKDALAYQLESIKKIVAIRVELDNEKKIRAPGNADRYLKALIAIERMDFSSLGETPHLDDSDASNTILKLRLIAEHAVRP